VRPTSGADADVGGQILVGSIARITRIARIAVAAAVISVVVIIAKIVVVGTEARTSKRLTEAGGASFGTTSGVMDAPDGSPAIPAREIDDPARGLHFVPPTDGFERIATDDDGIGQAADPLHHFPLALWTHAHSDSSFNSQCCQGKHRVRL
jgi:hypothetical protein